MGDLELLKHQNDISVEHRPAVCHRHGSGSAAFRRFASGKVGIDGLWYCGNSSCWFCSRKHADEKRAEWLRIMQKADLLGDKLATLTLTIRTSHKNPELANPEALDVLYTAFAKFSRSKDRKALGWVDYLRALEIVLSLSGKAHGHFNVVLVCKRDVDFELLERQLKQRWRDVVSQISYRHSPSLEHGAVLRPIETGESIGRVSRYATKLGALDSASRECLQSFTKFGAGLSPEQLLIRSYAGDLRARNVFRHWQTLVLKRRRYASSKSLESRLDARLRASGVDPASFEFDTSETCVDPEAFQVDHDPGYVAFVRGRTRAMFWHRGWYSAVAAKLSRDNCPELEFWLSAILDAHGSGELSNEDFVRYMFKWFERPSPVMAELPAPSPSATTHLQ